MITDVLTLAILALFVLWGRKKGAIKMAVKILSLGASMVLGYILHRPISGALTGLGIEKGLTDKLAENIDGMIHLPGVMKEMVLATGATGELAGAVAGAAVSAVSFLAVVALVRVLLMVVGVVAGVAGAVPVIKQTNGLLGGIIGFATGALVLFLIFGVIAVAEIFGNVNIAAKIFDGSILSVLLYDNNPLLGLVI